MTRNRLRTLTLVFASVALFLFADGRAPGQGGSVDLKPYRMDAKSTSGANLDNLPGDMIIRMGELKDGKLRTRGPEEKANRELFRQVAQYYVFKVTHEQYYATNDTGEIRPRNPELTMDVLLAELEARFILVPPTDVRITGDQMDYIIEFGAALDAAVVAVLNNKTPPPIIRLNAARMLALAAKTGAPAHGKTILALLNNTFFKRDGKPAETPPEVLYHALRAAEGFFAAYDPRQFGTPRWGFHWLMYRADDFADLLALIKVLETMALNGPPVAEKAYVPPAPPTPKTNVTDPATADPQTTQPKVENKGPTPEQLQLLKYYRRQAVRALAKVRFDTLPLEANPAGEVRPAFAIAKIAVADASINPTVTAAEAIEAVIGLCGILPSQNLNMDLVLEAVGKGVRSAYAFQGRPESEKTIAWKVYSARLKVALDTWKKNAAGNARLRPHLQQITELADLITADILDKIASDEKAVLTRLDAWVSNVSQRDPNRPVYNDNAQTKLTPRDVVAR
jgi:hypothetical protein